MTQRTYSLIFRGDLVAGYTAGDVKANMARLFKSGPQGVEKLFSGRPLILRKGLSRAQAEQFQATLAKIGAEVTLRDESGSETARTTMEQKSAVEPESQGPRVPTWTLAPMEGNLIKDHERERSQPVEVSVAHITLRAAEGPLLDKGERPEPVPVPLNIPQWTLD
ncbi:hypothetical protein [uncultured Microbulbifer sp.]|uniref:hypothetical protein n=1 Tax=uncultured Microbulbifer sp. TaxID=348147 RepID=UPI002635201F|nr:hypothetical protein [uncultured Microbulbifer sp.]